MTIIPSPGGMSSQRSLRLSHASNPQGTAQNAVTNTTAKTAPRSWYRTKLHCVKPSSAPRYACAQSASTVSASEVWPGKLKIKQYSSAAYADVSHTPSTDPVPGIGTRTLSGRPCQKQSSGVQGCLCDLTGHRNATMTVTSSILTLFFQTYIRNFLTGLMIMSMVSFKDSRSERSKPKNMAGVEFCSSDNDQGGETGV
jgi:hypothetical protein